MTYRCGNCGYEGPCYGTPIFHPAGARVSAPWCPSCQLNNKLEPIAQSAAPAHPDCGCCKGDGSMCKTTCRLAEDSPPAVPLTDSEVISQFLFDSAEKEANRG